MESLFYLLGIVLFFYWLKNSGKPSWNRPEIIRIHSSKILTFSVILLLLSFYLHGKSIFSYVGSGLIILAGVASHFWSKNWEKLQAEIDLDETESWFNEKKINLKTIRTSIYREPSLAKNFGAIVIVGSAEKIDGTYVGFVLEMISKKGVLEGVFLEPGGIASWHKSASVTAKMSGLPLMEVLQEMAKLHRKRHNIKN